MTKKNNKWWTLKNSGVPTSFNMFTKQADLIVREAIIEAYRTLCEPTTLRWKLHVTPREAARAFNKTLSPLVTKNRTSELSDTHSMDAVFVCFLMMAEVNVKSIAPLEPEDFAHTMCEEWPARSKMAW